MQLCTMLMFLCKAGFLIILCLRELECKKKIQLNFLFLVQRIIKVAPSATKHAAKLTTIGLVPLAGNHPVPGGDNGNPPLALSVVLEYVLTLPTVPEIEPIPTEPAGTVVVLVHKDWKS